MNTALAVVVVFVVATAVVAFVLFYPQKRSHSIIVNATLI